MKFIIYGVGAIGGTFAARLVQSGQSVAGIARGAQLEALQANGLLLRTPEGDIHARFPVASDPTALDIGENDVVFLTPGEPRPRDIVAALIDGESTLKRFLVERGQPFLRAENPRYPDLLPADELVIQGVMVGLLRTGTS